MTETTYTHWTETHDGFNFLLITDTLKKGLQTNDPIERRAVIIAKERGININDHIVLYPDTSNTWDAFLPQKKAFVFLGTDNPKAAIEKYIVKAHAEAIQEWREDVQTAINIVGAGSMRL